MIEVRHGGGVGVNGVYAVMRDGVHIATIKRTGRHSYWGIYTHYGHNLKTVPDVARARQAVHEVSYPTKREVYELLCARAEHNRRVKLEEHHAHDFARLAREIVAGSNSARVELEELVAEIERRATDRTATNVEHEVKCYHSYLDTLYPQPPEEGRAS
jgi:hypothetical protein